MNQLLLCYSLPMSEGMSEAARKSSEVMRQNQYSLRDSHLGLNRVVFEDLDKIGKECESPGWDGYGALPVEKDTIRVAYHFLMALPLGTPTPTVGVEPDGHLTLEWYRTVRWTLSVSISPKRDLYYAGLFGTSKAYGTEVFFGRVPDAILNHIHRIYSY